MNARAACRLEALGFETVYRYAPGKGDWLAAGLPTEGTGSGKLRAHHAVTRAVPTCSLDAPVSEAAEVAQSSGQAVCLVVDADRVVLGRLRGDALRADSDERVERVMEEGPTTTRADDDLPSLVARMRKRNVGQMIVTNADGQLIGVLFRSDGERLLERTDGVES